MDELLGTGGRRPGSVAPAFRVLDTLVRRYDRLPYRPTRTAALRAIVSWIVERQEADGSWGGIQPPWVWSLIALACRGHGPESPAMRNGLTGWGGFLVQDGDRLRPEACQSPVWDTGLAVLGLRAAGLPADHPGLIRAAEWILAEEVRARGDWALRTPGVPPGGWAFEYDNDLYPDVDDAACGGAVTPVSMGTKSADAPPNVPSSSLRMTRTRSTRRELDTGPSSVSRRP